MTIELPEFEARRYNERIVLDSIAAGATFGILIPPSLKLTVEGVRTNIQSGSCSFSK